MQVVVETFCGRCGKKTDKNVDIEEANKLAVAQKTKDEELGRLISEITELLESKQTPPELVVLHRANKDEAYDITVMNNLCSNPGVGRGKRGCKERIVTLLKELRLENKKKKNKKEEGTEQETTTEQE